MALAFARGGPASGRSYQTALGPNIDGVPARPAPDRRKEGVAQAVEHAIGLADRYGTTLHARSVIDATRLGLLTPTDADVEEVRGPLRTVTDRLLRAAEVPVLTVGMET